MESTGRNPGGSRAGEDPFLARTLQPRAGDRARYSGVSWAARLGRGRRSRDRIPALFRTLSRTGGWGWGLRLSAFPDGLSGPSKTSVMAITLGKGAEGGILGLGKERGERARGGEVSDNYGIGPRVYLSPRGWIEFPT